MKQKQVIIVGGGLAGWVSAIHLAKKGIRVQLIEKKALPFHKFCGEYLSKEVLPYLHSLGISPKELGAKEITKFRLSSHTGKYVETSLPLGGFGIRRYTLDYQLSKIAQQVGVEIILEKEVRNITFKDGLHQLLCKDKSLFQAPLVIGAYGKRSVLDKNLDREFFKQKSSYIGVKYYFKYSYPSNLVSLHNFQGGYCGMAKMEDESLNVCYLGRKEILQKLGSIDALEQKVLSKNPHIRDVFQNGQKLLRNPIIISNISFDSKEIIKNKVLMCGDAAGMIFPLAGNGMAMAIHGAKILSELILSFINGSITREELERDYQEQWRKQFQARLAWGRRFQPFMGRNFLSKLAVNTLKSMPQVLHSIIKRTHGSPIHAITKT